jgi:hypothetical protein
MLAEIHGRKRVNLPKDCYWPDPGAPVQKLCESVETVAIADKQKYIGIRGRTLAIVGDERRMAHVRQNVGEYLAELVNVAAYRRQSNANS